MAKPTSGRPVTAMPAHASDSGKAVGLSSSRTKSKASSEILAKSGVPVIKDAVVQPVKSTKNTPKITAEMRQLQDLNKQLENDNKRLSEELNRKGRYIHVLNQSLIAQQNYVVQALAVANPAGLGKIEASFSTELAWLLKQTMKFGPMGALKNFKAYQTLKSSGQFDAHFYASQVDGAKAFSAAQLLRHYVTEGFRKPVDPSAAFSVRKYLDFYPDVKASGAEPLSHYILHGETERRVALPSDAAHSDAGGDTVLRVYQPAIAPRALKVAETPEEREAHGWLLQRRPGTDVGKFGLYDFRPEDDVIVEGRAGDAFMAKFGLLSDAPDFAGAVAHLNSMTPKSRVVTRKDEPVDATIVIPIYGQLNYTLNAIHALLLHESKYSFEILIGDDCSPDESGKWLSQLSMVRYVLHPVNGGFIKNCNETARHGHGDTMVMLNNDTRVIKGWLDWMLDSFALFPKAGLIGSKLFYPDGSLQEAGGIIWQDGSGWNYGRGDDPNRPRYCYARQIDYVSGCSIAIPTKLWNEMAGFDPHYTPAYCEDVDLCFRLRAAGYETWYQPLSRIIHYEGKTSGTDTGQGVKAYQVANTVKLRERWKEVLASHRPNAQEPWLERERKVKKRVLVIDACNPTPMQDAGSVSIINLFRYYQALDYQVSFVPEDNFLFQNQEVRAMQATGVQCYYAPYELSMAKLFQRYGGLYDMIHVIRAGTAHKNLELIQTLAPKARRVYQTSDLHFLRMERQAAVENKPDMLEAAKAMKIKELNVVRNYDVTVTHSDVEKQILSVEVPDAKVVVMPLIEKVVPSSAPYEGRKDLMFLGGYGHEPNVDAALWLIEEIWPAISKALPEARLLLVGAKPPKAILDKASDRIVVTGLVDDLAPWFDKTRLFLAALRYGAGAKGKVLSSLAHGVPVIATDIAAEGLPLEDGSTAFMANSAEEIIAQTLRLYRLDEKSWKAYSKKANTYIDEHHSFKTGVVLLKQVVND